ncbi:MAG: GNAT family N-acetyltransferase [Oricola sp.]
MRDIVEIRLAAPSERSPLEALQMRASLANDGDRAALLAHPDAVSIPDGQIEAGQVFVAEAGGTMLGFAAVLPRDDGCTELDGLFVEPELWRGGTGRLLVTACVEYCRRHGSPALMVLANPHAEGFYRACGFESYGTQKTRFGSGLLMRRDIDAR